jgi:hypothetical protein
MKAIVLRVGRSLVAVLRVDVFLISSILLLASIAVIGF